ncbi:ankyrin repeat protein [Trichinella nativa]|uniref:Ankyrin repeat protein n=1 Tax=Trichinella nativa TaxID=6335 RepID=A0A1Y3EHC1_9BILA|nr:ankyrin repeat protein [Trichinella nativa]
MLLYDRHCGFVFVCASCVKKTMSEGTIFLDAFEGKFEKVKNEVDNCKDLVNVKDENGRTIFHWAASGGHLNLIEFLAPLVNDINDGDEVRALTIACSAGRLDVVQYLLDCKADPNIRSCLNTTPLHYAASKGHANIVKLLLEHNADVNAQDKWGGTPLHRVASKGGPVIIRLLLEDKNCQVNLQDSEGNTPLHLACEGNNENETICLINSGAQFNKKNKENKTPFDLASPELSRLLRRVNSNG